MNGLPRSGAMFIELRVLEDYLALKERNVIAPINGLREFGSVRGSINISFLTERRAGSLTAH